MDGLESIASPLTTLTQKSVKFEWSKACERNFHVLKDSPTSSHVLTLLEATKGFDLYYVTYRVGFVCAYATWEGSSICLY